MEWGDLGMVLLPRPILLGPGGSDRKDLANAFGGGILASLLP